MRHQGERPSGVHWAHLKGLLQAGQHYPNTASCSAQGWDREGLPNREEKTKAKVKSNAFGKGDARWGRSSWPLVIMTGLFCSAVTCSMSTPFHSDSNRGDGCRSLLAEFLHLPNQYRIWYINPRFAQKVIYPSESVIGVSGPLKSSTCFLRERVGNSAVRSSPPCPASLVNS